VAQRRELLKRSVQGGEEEQLLPSGNRTPTATSADSHITDLCLSYTVKM